MSIEKILQRIKMIENNDFNLNKEELNEDNQLAGTKKDWDAIIKKGSSSTNLAISRSSANTSDIQNAANSLLGRGPQVRFVKATMNNLEKGRIIEVYKLMKKNNVLPNDIDDNTLEPKNSNYKIINSGKTLIVQSDELIHFIYTDNSRKKLSKMIVKKESSFSDSDFDSFYNDLAQSKTKVNYIKINRFRDNNGIDSVQINFTR